MTLAVFTVKLSTLIRCRNVNVISDISENIANIHDYAPAEIPARTVVPVLMDLEMYLIQTLLPTIHAAVQTLIMENDVS